MKVTRIIFLFFLLPFSVFADTVEINDGAIQSTIDIQYDTLTMQSDGLSGSPRFFLFELGNSQPIYQCNGTLCDSLGFVDVDVSILSPDTQYYLSAFGSPAQATLDNVILYYTNGLQPYSQGNFYGAIYFETDSDNNLNCYANDNDNTCDIFLEIPQDDINLMSTDSYYIIENVTCQNFTTSTSCNYTYATATPPTIYSINRNDSLVFAFGFLLLLAGIMTWGSITRKLS